jgi:polyisoprenoid-binding protein YceI
MTNDVLRANAYRVFLGILSVFLAASAGANAQKQHLHLDPNATEVHFTLKDTVHTVHGTFHLKSGDVIFDPKTGEASGMIAVDTGSGASGNDSRDGKMKREYLGVLTFPVASFEPQHVSAFDPAAGWQKLTVNGTMTLHGAAHAMTMEFTISRADGGQLTANTHFMIPYVAWGIKDPSIALIRVEKEVSMDVVARGTLSAE